MCCGRQKWRPIGVKLSKSALDNPSPFLDMKPLSLITYDVYFYIQIISLVNEGASVAFIGPNQGQVWTNHGQQNKHRTRNHAVMSIGWCDLG